jgi:hypothetical protein
MFWMIVTRFFSKTEILRDFLCTLKAGIFPLKRFSLLSLKSVFDFCHYTRAVEDKARSIWKHFRNNRICCLFTICKSRSGFGRIFCTVFETVCASSLAMCAYQIGEHLHSTFSDHLDLYSQQSNPNVRFPSVQIHLFSEWIMSLVWNILNRK